MKQINYFLKDLLKLEVINKAKYIILIFFILSLTINFYFQNNYKKIYKIESYVFFYDIKNYEILHEKLKFYKRNFYDQIDLAGFVNTASRNSGNIFSTIYDAKYNQFIH